MFKDRILDTFFPRACAVCDELLSEKEKSEGKYVCGVCSDKLVYIREPRCKKCGRMLDSDTAEYCGECVRKNHLYKEGIPLLAHNDAAAKIIYSLKYSNRRENAVYIAEELVRRNSDNIFRWKADVLIPVPLHRKKYIKRGFNQAEVIARRISQLTGIPVINDHLIRSKHTVPQKNLDERARAENLRGAFAISGSAAASRFIIVDDIYTTGSTLNECAGVLLSGGAADVFFITASIVG